MKPHGHLYDITIFDALKTKGKEIKIAVVKCRTPLAVTFYVWINLVIGHGGNTGFFLSSDIRGSLRKYNEGGIQKKKMEIFNEIFHEIINHGYDFYLRRDNIDHI